MNTLFKLFFALCLILTLSASAILAISGIYQVGAVREIAQFGAPGTEEKAPEKLANGQVEKVLKEVKKLN